jgi:hypothetical protein
VRTARQAKLGRPRSERLWPIPQVYRAPAAARPARRRGTTSWGKLAVKFRTRTTDHL